MFVATGATARSSYPAALYRVEFHLIRGTKENSLCFPAQTRKIIDTHEESGYFIVETMGISRCNMKRMKGFAQNRKRKLSLAVLTFDMVNIG